MRACSGQTLRGDAVVVVEQASSRAPGDCVLRVSNLRTRFGDESSRNVVDGVSFAVNRGQSCALVGESGCGKSMTALSIMRLLPPGAAVVGGSVSLTGTELGTVSETQMRSIRGHRMAMIFQEPHTCLNPLMTVGKQIAEVLVNDKANERAHARVRELLDAVGMSDPERQMRAYPHQLSGGMRQRVMIAMALAGEPELLIADEPTTALDVTIQAQVLALLTTLQRQFHMGMLLITHDLGVVAQMADTVAVMYAGELVETAPAQRFFANPKHPYTKRLFAALPGRGKRGAPLTAIRGQVPGACDTLSACRFEPRCDWSLPGCADVPPEWSRCGPEHHTRCHLYSGDAAWVEPTSTAVSEPAPGPRDEPRTPTLEVDSLSVSFPVRSAVLQRKRGQVRAVDQVSMSIDSGETLALVGESGCGKTTTAKAILRLIEPDAGSIRFAGADFRTLNARELRAARSDVQTVFQDPYASLNPRMRVGAIIEEGLIIQAPSLSKTQRIDRVHEVVVQVGLALEQLDQYPHELSGGQRQRVCIARALAVRPKLIVCDEPTSALDVSVQAQILNLLRRLQRELGLAYLFITHDLSVVEYLAHRVAVMYLGRVVEAGSVAEVLQSPLHPYTQALVSAVPRLEPERGPQRAPLEGELPSALMPPAGCYFHPRCPHVRDICRVRYPGTVRATVHHEVACHLALTQR